MLDRGRGRRKPEDSKDTMAASQKVEEIPGISMFYKKGVVNRVICGRITERDQNREMFS